VRATLAQRHGAVHRRPPLLRQVDRAHRDFRPEQIEFLANIARLYRGEAPETVAAVPRCWPNTSRGRLPRHSGVCRLATRAEIEVQAGASTPAAMSA